MLPISQRFTIFLSQYLTQDIFVHLCFTGFIKEVMSKHVQKNPMEMKITWLFSVYIDTFIFASVLYSFPQKNQALV